MFDRNYWPLNQQGMRRPVMPLGTAIPIRIEICPAQPTHGYELIASGVMRNELLDLEVAGEARPVAVAVCPLAVAEDNIVEVGQAVSVVVLLRDTLECVLSVALAI